MAPLSQRYFNGFIVDIKETENSVNTLMKVKRFLPLQFSGSVVKTFINYCVSIIKVELT